MTALPSSLKRLTTIPVTKYRGFKKKDTTLARIVVVQAVKLSPVNFIFDSPGGVLISPAKGITWGLHLSET